MICEKKFSNMLTTIDKIKNKISSNEYLVLMNQLKDLFNILDGEFHCEECGEIIVDDSDDSDCDLF